MELTDSVIAVTGAARGIGAGIAMEVAARGAHVALIDLDLDALGAVLTECRAAGVTAEGYVANVADEKAVVSAFDRIATDFGRLDAAIANAGILRDGLLVKVREGDVVSRMSLEDWQAVIDVNLTGVFLTGREAARVMIESGKRGCIVTISSISRHGNFGQSNYSAAKAGVAALTVVWAKELARYGIRCNAIAPGFIATDILKDMKPEALEKMSASIPVGRVGTPEEIAATAAFILENDYMNGRVIEVDGGQRL